MILWDVNYSTIFEVISLPMRKQLSWFSDNPETVFLTEMHDTLDLWIYDKKKNEHSKSEYMKYIGN